jgi:hypothetical protein
MQTLATDLDHVGTIVRDLDKGRRQFEAMGFALTARSQHRGSVEPGGPVQPLGQANHCAMLRSGYLEVLGIVDTSLPTPASIHLGKYEGLHIVSVRPSSIDDVLPLAGQGPLDAARDLGREVLWGPSGAEKRPVRFINIRFNAASFPQAQFMFTEHLTRETMWQPHLLEHPNGADSLSCVFVCSPEPAVLARRLGEVYGVVPTALKPDRVELKMQHSSVLVASSDALKAMFPGVPIPNGARPVGYQVSTVSLDRLVDVLTSHGVPYGKAPLGGVFVGPEHACGNVIHFVERQ